MQLQEILYTQGFGTRRVCAGLVQQGFVQVYMPEQGSAPVTITQAAMEFVAEGLRFRVQGVDWPYAERAYLMLNKPAGYTCSMKDPGRIVFDLLPPRFRLRCRCRRRPPPPYCHHCHRRLPPPPPRCRLPCGATTLP